MPLTDTAIRLTKPREKPYKLADGGGLTLIIQPNGSKWWRMRYRAAGIEKMLSFGVYPDTTLKRARERRDDARKLLADKLDPGLARKTALVAQKDTFDAIAKEWLDLQVNPPPSGHRASLTAVTAKKTRWMLESFLIPDLGSRSITEIKPVELFTTLRKIETRGRRETAHRTRSLASRVFRYAVASGRAERDITVDLRGALAPVVSKNRAAITDPERIGELLRAIDGYEGQSTTAYALKFSPYVFVRPGELHASEWNEIDLNAAEWRIPAERMKMRDRHIVPLAKQAIALLKELQTVSGYSRYLFPSLRAAERPMSNNTVNAALRRLGYSIDEMTGHGFRALASTCLNEQGWHPDLIELQLAHAERNKVRSAYNRAQRLPDRKKMMQAWADYLDQLRSGKAIQINAAA